MPNASSSAAPDITIDVANRTSIDHGVGAEPSSLARHPVQRLLARLRQQLRVLRDFTADDVSQNGDDVASDVPRPNRIATYETQRADDPFSGP